MVVLFKKRMILGKYQIVNEKMSGDNIMPGLGLFKIMELSEVCLVLLYTLFSYSSLL